LRKHLVTLLISGLLVAVIGLACGSSESAETQALYTDAKQMFEDINGAFQLPKSQARVDTMRRIIGEKWDEQVVSKLEQYLEEAPDGEYAGEAKELLGEVKSSMYINMLSQARPLMEQDLLPETEAETDSMLEQMRSMEPDSQ
jgi:hypothetical protein